MSITVRVNTVDDALREERTSAAWRVMSNFSDKLVQSSLLCFLDNEDWQALKEQAGIANRGFYAPIRKGRWPPWWPEAPTDVKEALMIDGQIAFSDFIYLHGSTCSSELGLTMTLAHEAQHAFQHGNTPSLWAANTLVPNLPKPVINALGLTWCDIPVEREARIVAKQIAERQFGTESVTQYIDAKIAEPITETDAADWECIKRLDSSDHYDLALETELFFPRLRSCRSELERVLRHLQADADDLSFQDVDLPALLEGAPT